MVKSGLEEAVDNLIIKEMQESYGYKNWKFNDFWIEVDLSALVLTFPIEAMNRYLVSINLKEMSDRAFILLASHDGLNIEKNPRWTLRFMSTQNNDLSLVNKWALKLNRLPK